MKIFQQTVICLVLAAAFSFSGGCASSSTSKAGPQKTICKNQDVPAGYVIVGETTNIQCPGGINNAWIIEKTGAQRMVICSDQEVPKGYVIVGQTTDIRCPGGINNAWIIEKANTNE